MSATKAQRAMSQIAKRRLIDGVITFATIALIVSIHSEWQAPLLTLLYGGWNFYDGMTRMDLHG